MLARRLVDPRLIPSIWWLVILLLVPVVHLLSGAAATLAGYQPTVLLASSLTQMGLVHLVGFAAFILLLGPLPEEIGWRGYGLPALMNRFDPLAASLVLGAAWSLWHIPLFFMAGYYEPFGGAPDPALFFLNILIISILYTWIFLHTHGSVLAAILFHFSVNFTGEILPLSAEGELIKTAILALIGGMLATLMTKGQRAG